MTSHEGLGPIMKQQVILTLFKKNINIGKLQISVKKSVRKRVR